MNTLTDAERQALAETYDNVARPRLAGHSAHEG
ncbi:hypothetical protein A8926_6791 [Saccharopolyspora spinosa]|uniref:Uncharacterized protein n=1 Tax=Saccharopolyspora spinosa TaxID=60894 RepID=A0A2N3Y732_SACSN|nr:hypothetical protein A8926_6791 [Saccharopolyspora spinosa]